MFKKHRLASLTIMSVGFVTLLVGCVIGVRHDAHGSIAQVFAVLGATLLFCGSCYGLWAKGYHPAWGFLLFLAGPLVLILFLFLPERSEKNGVNP